MADPKALEARRVRLSDMVLDPSDLTVTDSHSESGDDQPMHLVFDGDNYLALWSDSVQCISISGR